MILGGWAVDMLCTGSWGLTAAVMFSCRSMAQKDEDPPYHPPALPAPTPQSPRGDPLVAVVVVVVGGRRRQR